MNYQRPWRARATVLLLLLLGLSAACTAPQSAERAAEERVSTALRKATGSASPEELSTETRWNPATCDAPEWQVMLWGAWVRAELHGLDDSARVEGVATRQLRTTRSTVTDTRGWKYPVFEVAD
jgi:hypothetical protein